MVRLTEILSKEAHMKWPVGNRMVT